MDLRKGFFPLFLTKLVPAEHLPSIQDRIADDERIRARIKRDPALSTVEMCLRLKGYEALSEHSDAFIAETAGMRVCDVQERLHWLEWSGRIRRKNGKYQTVSGLGLDNLTGDAEALAHLRRHWAERNLDRFSTPDGVPANSKQRPNFQSCLVCTVSKEDMGRIFEILNRCFEEIRQLEFLGPQPEEEVRVLLMDFFSPDDAPVRAFPLHQERPASSDNDRWHEAHGTKPRH